MFVFAAYLMLSLPVTGIFQVFIDEHGGATVADLRAAGLRLRFERQISVGRREKGRARGIALKALRRVLVVQRVHIRLRIGLGDAWQTALAAGGMKAAAFSLLGALGAPRNTQVIVTPDFVQVGFCLQLRCIFSACAGDIMLAAASEAVKMKMK